jgi:hypothetical protein
MNEPLLARIRPRAMDLWRRVEKPARIVLFVLVVGMLAHNLNAIGWGAMARNLPVTPWFYAVFVVNYFSLPFFETLIYHELWKTGPRLLPVLLRKRVYNEAVLEYSGESALIMWAASHTPITKGEAFRDVRDVNILSTLAGNLVTCFVLVAVIFGAADRLGVGDATVLRRGALFTGGIVLVLVTLAAVFRRRFLSLSLGRCLGVFALHTARLFTFMGLLALQWHVAEPAIGWQTWSIFIALQMAVSRLPLIPAKDLFFTGLAMRLGARITLAPAVLAGLFIASSGLNLMVHALMYGVGHLAGRKPPPTEA